MKNRSRALLWIVGTFVLGAVFGAMLMSIRSGPGTPPGPQGFFSRRPADNGRTVRMMERLTEVLELDAAQQEELRKILEKARERYQAHSRESRRQRRAIRTESRERIQSILTPEQMERFQKFLQQHHHKKGPKPPGTQ